MLQGRLSSAGSIRIARRNPKAARMDRKVSFSLIDFLNARMEDRPDPRPWLPQPFSIAVLDSDETLADTLCGLLRDSGFVATAFYDIAPLTQAHREKPFDAYVLDYLADWQPQSNALGNLVASIRSGTDGDVPVFILGNQIAPESTEKLGNILIQHKVRYLLKPLRASYLARQVVEAVAARAGL